MLDSEGEQAVALDLTNPDKLKICYGLVRIYQ